jgi:hypothetical protein
MRLYHGLTLAILLSFSSNTKGADDVTQPRMTPDNWLEISIDDAPIASSKRSLQQDTCACKDGNLQLIWKLQYQLPSQTSSFHGSSKSTCIKSDYPSSTSITIDDLSPVQVKNRTRITIGGTLNKRTVFKIKGWGSCYIDTSCSSELITGDQIGPFLVLAGSDCGNVPVKPTSSPVRKPTRQPSRKPTPVPKPRPTPVPKSKPTSIPNSKSTIPATKSPQAQKTPVPVTKRTEAPTPNLCVVSDRLEYSCGDPISVNFDYSRNSPSRVARTDDRIGIFPCYIDTYKQAEVWQWICGAPPQTSDKCSVPKSSGNIVFEKLPSYNDGGQAWPVTANYNKVGKFVNRCFKIVILRNDGEPYTPYCTSERITINENSKAGCSIRLFSPTD